MFNMKFIVLPSSHHARPFFYVIPIASPHLLPWKVPLKSSLFENQNIFQHAYTGTGAVIMADDW